jgi:hypothetical protein
MDCRWAIEVWNGWTGGKSRTTTLGTILEAA